MLRPRYTWWPWRALALAVPVVAAAFGVAATLLAAEQMDLRKAGPLTFLTIFGAGNGFLLGIAIGDFGRSVLSMLAGAVAALLAVKVFGEASLPLGPFFIVAAITATLALEWTVRGIVNAVGTGLVAFSLGLLVGLAAMAVTFLLLCVVLGFRLGTSWESDFAAILAVILGAAVGNAVFVGRLFRAAIRTEAPSPVPPAVPEEPGVSQAARELRRQRRTGNTEPEASSADNVTGAKGASPGSSDTEPGGR